MWFFKILFFGLILSGFQQVRADTVQINPSADVQVYVASQSYNDTSYQMNVGQYANGYNLHYYVGLASWTGVDLSTLAGQSSTTLRLYVQDFLTPDLSNGGGATSIPSLSSSSTGNFTLKVVALSGTPNPANINDAWVKTNMIDAAGVGSVTLTSSGYNTVNIGSTVANWISAGTGSRWLGFVGTGSSSAYNSVKLGTLEPYKDFDGTVISPAAPMYLTIPEPSVSGLFGSALFYYWMVRRKRSSL
jgi:hypothetical protein